MFLKRERPKRDDFVIKKWLWRKKDLVEKFYISRITSNFIQVLADTLTKVSEHFFAYSWVLDHPKHFVYFPNKNFHFLSEKGFAPPPPLLADISAKNVLFLLDGSPLCNELFSGCRKVRRGIWIRESEKSGSGSTKKCCHHKKYPNEVKGFELIVEYKRDCLSVTTPLPPPLLCHEKNYV